MPTRGLASSTRELNALTPRRDAACDPSVGIRQAEVLLAIASRCAFLFSLVRRRRGFVTKDIRRDPRASLDLRKT